MSRILTEEDLIGNAINDGRADVARALVTAVCGVRVTHSQREYLEREIINDPYVGVWLALKNFESSFAEKRMLKHPMQPIELDDDGAARFRQNKLIKFLLDSYEPGLGKLSMLPFDNADYEQLMQLIGYSVCGYCELSLVSEKSKDDAWNVSSKLEKPKKKKTRKK
jgi:hypothetical protein